MNPTLSTIRTVLYLLGAALLASIGGIVFLVALGRPVPDVLPLVTIGSLTGMTGMLTRSPADASRDESSPQGGA